MEYTINPTCLGPTLRVSEGGGQLEPPLFHWLGGVRFLINLRNNLSFLFKRIHEVWSWFLKCRVDLWSCEDVPLLTSCPFQLQISGEKWRRKSRRSWSCTRSWRRLVRLQLSLFRQGEACPLWSFSFRPHLQQHLHLQHRLQPWSQLLLSVTQLISWSQGHLIDTTWAPLWTTIGHHFGLWPLRQF